MKRIAVLGTLLLSGCALRISHANRPFTETAMTLVRDPLDIRLIQPKRSNEKPVLILFVTGDGGWRKLDQDVFTWIGGRGYPIAGFSASRYLKTMSEVSDVTTPPKLAADFARVIEFAKQSMQLPPNTSVVLIGISRGAGLASIAAGQPRLRSQIAGVIAIALGDIEEHVLRRQRRSAKGKWVAVETYRYLRRLTDLPIEIIQSTHDKYTTAAQARQLLGADTRLHHLHPIEAASHTFRGGVPALLAELQSSLDLLCSNSASAQAHEADDAETNRQCDKDDNEESGCRAFVDTQ
jgi:dienelactone hydrolase